MLYMGDSVGCRCGINVVFKKMTCHSCRNDVCISLSDTREFNYTDINSDKGPLQSNMYINATSFPRGWPGVIYGSIAYCLDLHNGDRYTEVAFKKVYLNCRCVVEGDFPQNG